MTRQRGRGRQRWLDSGGRRSWLRCQRCRSTSSTRTKSCSSKVWRSWRPPHLLLQAAGAPLPASHTHPTLLQEADDVKAAGVDTLMSTALFSPSFSPPPAPPARSPPLSHRCVSVPGGWGQQTGESWSPVFCVRRSRRSEVKAEPWCWLHLSRDPRFYPKTASAACLTQVGEPQQHQT